MNSKKIAIETTRICVYGAVNFCCGAYDYWRHGKRGVIAGLSSIAIAGIIGWGLCTWIEKGQEQ